MGVEELMNTKPILGLNKTFETAMKKRNAHPRLLKELASDYNKNQEAFEVEFKQCLAVLFMCPDKTPGLESVLDFAAKYCIFHENTFGEEDPFPESIFNFIFENHNIKNPNIRFRTCEFINRLLNEKGDQASLDQNIFENIGNIMLERLQDKSHTIRAQAVMALQRLQDPYDNDCAIVKAFVFHMVSDPSAIVREKVISHIAVTSQTLPHIIEKIKDVQVQVKKAAYKTLSRLKIQRFTINQRQSILTTGLKNRKEIVREFVIEQLIMTWFKQCNCDVLQLFKALDVETMNEDILKAIAFELFKKQPTSTLKELIKGMQNLEKLITFKNLTPEVAALWYYAVQYFSSTEIHGNDIDEDSIFQILPELTAYTDYIKEFLENLKLGKIENKYIMKLLLKMASSYSLSDEMGRMRLKQLCINLLTYENELSFIPILVSHIQKTMPIVKERLTVMAEIISDIREPLFDKTMVELNESATIEQQMANLQCGTQMLECERELRKDPETLIRCLTIILEFIKAPDVQKLDPTLLTLKDHFIVGCLSGDHNSHVLNLAQQVMAIMCIWNSELANQQFLYFFIQVNDNDLCLSALDAIFDILLVHGLNLYNFGTDSYKDQPSTIKKKEFSLADFSQDATLPTNSMKQLIGIFVSLLDTSVPEVRAKVCLGLAKLLLSGHISSPLVLAHLTLAWFNPETEQDPEVRQGLGMFFSLFSTKRLNSGQIVIDSFIPTLRAINEADDTQPIAEIDQVSVSKLLISLVRSDLVSNCSNFEELGSYHYRLAVVICDELNSGDVSIWVLVKALSYLDLDLSDGHFAPTLLSKLKTVLKQMKKLTDKRIYRMLETFKSKVEELNANYKKDNNKEKIQDASSSENTEEEIANKKPRKGKTQPKIIPESSELERGSKPSEATFEIESIESGEDIQDSIIRKRQLVIETANSDSDKEENCVIEETLSPAQVISETDQEDEDDNHEEKKSPKKKKTKKDDHRSRVDTAVSDLRSTPPIKARLRSRTNPDKDVK
ncbi:condensin complex subunit 3 isoform X2 [Cimex lectularius]|uniref:Nuclear condensin complex subunit 3 C-terminal domain-containing protein n=1 Tax=Cimex lectularius TaxID=79782 RepID=A0A8I6RYP7_CIMLE|nr:condensin complex subunit 3 isoform X2 [Cimex lectularius]